MLISPDTLQVLLTAFAEVVNVANITWLRDADLVWYSPSVTHWICRGCEGGDHHWTVGISQICRYGMAYGIGFSPTSSILTVDFPAHSHIKF